MKAFALALALAACGESATGGIELVEAPSLRDPTGLIAGERALASLAPRQLVVYVGAPWCEPCTHFHDAAARGALDAAFGDVRLLVFDADRDGETLDRAGYKYEMIPMFAIPREDGRSTGHHIEGSIKGASAIDQISPRLRALLDGQL